MYLSSKLEGKYSDTQCLVTLQWCYISYENQLHKLLQKLADSIDTSENEVKSEHISKGHNGCSQIR